MLSKKYIFETKTTRFRRKVLGLFAILGLISAVYATLCFIIVQIAVSENHKSEVAFFQRAPDLIVIFTGDSGRIPLGLHKALEYRLPHVFITGVYNPNSIRTILRRQDNALLREIDIDSYFIEIDYWARNTIENVLSMTRYLHKKGGIKTVLIVSSDYHILRIKLILQMLHSPSDHYEYYFLHAPTNYHKWRNIKILLKEVFKSLKAFLFLMLWDYEQQLPSI